MANFSLGIRQSPAENPQRTPVMISVLDYVSLEDLTNLDAFVALFTWKAADLSMDREERGGPGVVELWQLNFNRLANFTVVRFISGSRDQGEEQRHRVRYQARQKKWSYSTGMTYSLFLSCTTTQGRWCWSCGSSCGMDSVRTTSRSTWMNKYHDQRNNSPYTYTLPISNAAQGTNRNSVRSEDTRVENAAYLLPGFVKTHK